MFLPYASSAFVPVDTMPSWLQGFAEHQPITPVVETLRGLLLDPPVGSPLEGARLVRRVLPSRSPRPASCSGAGRADPQSER